MDRPHDLFWYPWPTTDFQRLSRGWPLAAKGAYRELLDAQFDCGTLPVDPAELRRLVGATPAEWRRAWPVIEPLFPVVADDARQNLEMVEWRRKAEALRESRRRGAQKTNRRRWGDRVVELRGSDR